MSLAAVALGMSAALDVGFLGDDVAIEYSVLRTGVRDGSTLTAEAEPAKAYKISF
jgi:hypothetical protein